MSKPACVALMGPTASGKTALAFALADALEDSLPVDLISVDSALIYRGMDIGTAKPSAEERRRYPHALIDILDPVQSYSAARFREDALALMRESHARGHLPVLVGGTMLYYRALFGGIADLPDADPAVRQRIAAQAAELGWATLHEELACVDPEAAARIHPNDPQRIARALEVHALTGRALSQLQREGREAASDCGWRVLRLALAPEDRETLHRRIAERFRLMLAQGFVEEVEALRARGDLHLALPSMRAVGYRQIWECLDGKGDRATMEERGIIATRQFAKRQMTWLRSEPSLDWLVTQAPDVGRLVERVRRHLDGGLGCDKLEI